MKKQNSNNKLVLSKATIIELNDDQLNTVNGGSAGLLSLIVEITTYGTWLLVAE
jgi:bacteriocin-like protein